MNRSIKKFKEIKHVAYKKYNGDRIELNMLIPGVNSGVYTPVLHFSFKIIKQTNWFKSKTTVGDITLSIKDVEELRDECNLIIKEAEKQRRI